jgi:chaperonin cofactor prefoldin
MPNRTLCQVLDEMRECTKTLNFSYLQGLIEEVQSLANRMESKLYDLKDYEYKMKELKRIKNEIKELEEKKEVLDDAAKRKS